ncbi:MAG: serine--tRNA ligase [Acidobacteria bacterium]|nr:serine--tRNA ligase [Acidobacteriota bacterium]MYJ03886.1 serine--tRNA ligase [Acidobacteriota bacterium]
MIDPALLRDRPDDVRGRLRTRGDHFEEELDRLVQLDAERRAILPVLEAARHARKRIGEQIGTAKRAGESADHLVAGGQEQRALIEEQEAKLKGVEQALRGASLALPNLPHETVPEGATEQENHEIRRHGEPTSFDFEPQPHWDLGPALGILDFERATRIAGARFAVLSGAGARLARALINFMLDLHTAEHGYTEVEPPFLASADALTGTGNLPKFESDLFRIAGDWDLYLIPTAEVPLCNLHRGEILDGRDLPVRYVAYTPCFRSEAGAYGKDVRGLIRQHQFDKVELVAYAAPAQSWDVHEALTRHAEEVLKRLGLPYRTVLLCTGDMGFAASKTYDLEVWLPSQQTYREISSCSNTEAFQARRAGIRFRRDGKGKPEHVHTLNGSGVAVGRALVAILENFQQRDGSVAVPEVLRPYMGGISVIRSS